MKEKDLKVWLQQVGRGEACNCFCSPRSLAEHRAPGAVCPASRSSLPPGTRGLRARARLCSAPTPGRGSAAGPPRARVGATAAAAATGQGLTQGEREKPSLHCCAAQGRTHLQTWVRWHRDEDILCYIVTLLTDMSNDLSWKGWGVFWASL